MSIRHRLHLTKAVNDMMWRDAVNLISQTKTIDNDGYPILVDTVKRVCADCRSVRRMEYYEAVKNGLNLALSVRLRLCEYNGERLLAFNGKEYRVERTYSDNKEVIELSCSEVVR